MRIYLLLLFPFLLFDACTTIPAASLTLKPPQGNCAVISESIALQNNPQMHLPAMGLFTLESHLVASEDAFPAGAWPSTQTDRIAAHIARSCARGGFQKCAAVYNDSYTKEWTPAEGGAIGQGSTAHRPPAAFEMWSGNMLWTGKSKPPEGTRFLAHANGKSVVVIVGYETGPLSSEFVGGLQGEVFYALGADDTTPIAWARLEDQGAKPGPINCN